MNSETYVEFQNRIRGCFIFIYFIIQINTKMTAKEIKYRVIKELNGTKSLSKQQVDNFIEYMFFILPIEENSENKKIIIEGIKMYFKL